MFSKNRILLLIIFISALLTRFIGLTWGTPYFFHPDENNMATALSQLSWDSLNPHFFAYGQFPLYLGFFTLKCLNIANSFANSVYILRFYSIIFSLLSLLVIFFISKKIFHPDFILLPLIFSIFNPGLIQLAHFGTTESFLVFIFLSQIYFSFKIYDQKSALLYYFFSGIFSGIAIATKISSLIFLGPVLLVTLMNFLREKNKLRIILGFLILIVFTSIFYFLSSPYNLISKSDYLSAMNYETGVATGQIKVFYTTQFSKTIPYFFQFTKIFPYSAGIFQFIFFIIGFIFFIKNYSTKDKKFLYYFLILVPAFVYFLYFGQLYTKWTRFVSPLFFLFPLFSAYLISILKSKTHRLILSVLACLPALFFFRLYLIPDIRLQASSYFLSLPSNSTFLSESGNVVNLPLFENTFNVINYDFYNSYNPKSLSENLYSTDYILVPSRRVFKNYDYNYYQYLFDGNLGFQKLKIFSPSFDLFLNSENAEETWSVFDHPTIRLYQKTDKLSPSQYEALL